jgi:hypothetical protein
MVPSARRLSRRRELEYRVAAITSFGFGFIARLPVAWLRFASG